MNKRQIINKTKAHVRELLKDETTGHDWWHTYRVWNTVRTIAKEEKGVILFDLELAALLHDVGDWKLAAGNEESGPEQIREWLEKLKVEEKIIKHVVEIVSTMAYKGPKVRSKVRTREGTILQDADRLDAIGAIGVARAFATGHRFGQLLHDSTVKPRMNATREEYRKQYTGEFRNTTINHFYEKLLLLKDQMNTKKGKKIATKRHKFMEKYLERFFKEWNGKD